MKKKITVKKLPKAFTVAYSGGVDPTLDRTIERIAGKSSYGSGLCLDDGLRDLSFSFQNGAAAKKAADALKKIKGIQVTYD